MHFWREITHTTTTPLTSLQVSIARNSYIYPPFCTTTTQYIPAKISKKKIWAKLLIGQSIAQMQWTAREQLLIGLNPMDVSRAIANPGRHISQWTAREQLLIRLSPPSDKPSAPYIAMDGSRAIAHRLKSNGHVESNYQPSIPYIPARVAN